MKEGISIDCKFTDFVCEQMIIIINCSTAKRRGVDLKMNG